MLSDCSLCGMKYGDTEHGKNIGGDEKLLRLFKSWTLTFVKGFGQQNPLIFSVPKP